MSNLNRIDNGLIVHEYVADLLFEGKRPRLELGDELGARVLDGGGCRVGGNAACNGANDVLG